jgi:hypothetical protein
VDPTPASPSPSRSPGLSRAIAITALITGTFYGLAAVVSYMADGGTAPIRIFWSIASALIGVEAAFRGGFLTAELGVVLHYLVATIWTWLFFALYPRLRILGKYPFSAGVGYGFVVWVVMNLVVVPLSKAPKISFNPANAGIAVAMLMVCFGLPLSLFARRHFAKA